MSALEMAAQAAVIEAYLRGRGFGNDSRGFAVELSNVEALAALDSLLTRAEAASGRLDALLEQTERPSLEDMHTWGSEFKTRAYVAERNEGHLAETLRQVRDDLVRPDRPYNTAGEYCYSRDLIVATVEKINGALLTAPQFNKPKGDRSWA